jgi:hypothetical protein
MFLQDTVQRCRRGRDDDIPPQRVMLEPLTVMYGLPA